MALTLRRLTAEEVTFEMRVDQDDVPFKGNVMASGDAEVDREVEHWVESQLAYGNEWAWCIVTITARYRNFEGTDTLAGCSYESEEAFKACPYYTDLRAGALDVLNDNMAAQFDELSELVQKRRIEDFIG
jgi:hypothetical protein